MHGVKQFIIVAITYLVIICGTMYYSGIATRTSIYDKYLISSEGIIIPTSNHADAVRFYRDILDFEPIYFNSSLKEDKNIVGFKVSRFLSLFLVQKSTANESGSAVVIKVRNAFPKLQKALVNRTPARAELKVTEANYLDVSEKGRISAIIQKPWGKEFVAYDYDGNKIIYVQPKLWSRSRF